MSVSVSPPASRFGLGPLSLNVLATVLVFLAANATSLRAVASGFDGTEPRILAYVMGFGLNLFVISVFAPPVTASVQKMLLATLILLSAICAFFTETFGTLFDPDMIANILGTNDDEAKALISPDLLLFVALHGLLPAGLLLALPVRRTAPVKRLMFWALSCLLAASIFFGAQTLGQEAFADKSRKEIYSTAYTLQPAAVLVAAVDVLSERFQVWNLGFSAVGTDAKSTLPPASRRKPLLLVIALGESARSANHQIAGYNRETNPGLSRLPLVVYPKVRTCGTNTRRSIRCMFSDLDQKGFSNNKFLARENLVDVLAHAGIATTWFENDWMTDGGGVAERIGTTDFFESPEAARCLNGECDDAIFLHNLDQIFSPAKGDRVIVLHLVGSHFPYFRRYPGDTATFRPDCQQSVLTRCSAAEITNAYDNSIRFTDQILSAVIGRLQAEDGYATALLYTSDHGESLGENGIFLHSAPLTHAPAEQTTVPMFLWLSSAYSHLTGITPACLDAARPPHPSHDNFYPTVLGLMAVETQVRKPALDLTQPCRGSGRLLYARMP